MSQGRVGGPPDASHSSKWAGERMSGMRSWIGRMSSLAAMVMMVNVSSGSLLL